MNKTKLIQLISTFSHAEFSDFGKFLNSPFHNESTKMIRLYKFLKKYFPDFKKNGFTKENAFRKLYESGEKYDDKKLRDRFSDMLKLAEDFLAFICLKKNPVDFKSHTLDEFFDRGLEIHFDKKYKEIHSILERANIKGVNYFYNIFIQEKHKSDFYQHKQLLGKRKHVYDEFVIEVDMFLRYCASLMLSYYSTMYNWETNLNYEFNYKLYEPVMKFIEENKLTEYPIIKAYYLILKIRENEEDSDLYYELKGTYIKNAEAIDMDDKIRIGTILFNDAQKKFMGGKKGFDVERFEIMKLQLEHETYSKEGGWLSREQYINYVLIPVSLGYLEWAEKFIVNYTVKVAPDKRENAFHYVKGYLHYARKNYSMAISELSRVKGGDYVYFVRIKTLLSRVYFEKEDYENVLSIIDSFKHYISSNLLIPEIMKKRYTNYINILHKLTLLRLDFDEFKASKLIEEINGFSIYDLTTNRSWLLERALELK